MRDGSDLVGWGMATGVWEALQMPMAARIALTANGHAEVASAASDIGTGTYTIMAQVAADMLGPAARQHQRQARRLRPCRKTPVEGGSWMAASVSARDRATLPTRSARSCCGWHRTCRTSPLAGAKPEDVVARRRQDRQQAGRSRAVSIADAMRHGSVDRIEQEKTTKRFRRRQRYARNTHSAVFAEVKVDEQLGVIRVTRVVNAVAAGRILNTKTAHSQIIGRRGVGHRHGAARGDADRSPVRPHHECQHRRVPCAGERRRARHQGDLRRRARRRSSTRSASRAWARSASSASRRRSPTLSITRPESACAICRSRSTSCGAENESCVTMQVRAAAIAAPLRLGKADRAQ